MIEYSFDEFKDKLEALLEKGFEPELSLYLNLKKYMIIVYEDHCSFQRCRYNDDIGSGEYNSSSLDELYTTGSVDGMLLKQDWANITDWECFEIETFDF